MAHDADRLALHVVEKSLLDRHHGAFELVGHAAEIAVGDHRAGHVEALGVADRVAGIQRFKALELLSVCFYRIGELEQQMPPLGCRHIAPGGKGARRGVDRRIDIRVTRFRYFANRRIVMRVEHRDGAARLGIDEFIVDEELGFDLHVRAPALEFHRHDRRFTLADQFRQRGGGIFPHQQH